MTSILTRHCSLESLCITGFLSEPDMIHLLELLEHNEKVEKLCIGECTLSEVILRRLRFTLTTNKTLQHLSMPTQDADFVTEIFGKHKNTSSSLQHLTLGSGFERFGLPYC